MCDTKNGSKKDREKLDRCRRINTMRVVLQCSIFGTLRFVSAPSQEIRSMFATPEEVGAQSKNNIEQALKFAETTADAAEELFDLNLKTAKAAGADALRQLKALAGAKDIQELASLHTSFAQSNAEKLFGYGRAVYGWSTDAQAEITKLVDAHIAEVNKTFAAALDKAARSAPTGSEFAFAAVKSAMTAANQAYDALTKAGKQVTEMTEATISATPNPSRKKVA
ncbi:MAG TPA: phasin family protein [Burkholderiales bacterium]|nr:phasin family protein [Burkholderiales bacterium]